MNQLIPTEMLARFRSAMPRLNEVGQINLMINKDLIKNIIINDEDARSPAANIEGPSLLTLS